MNLELTVIYVKVRGNANSGQYFYSYNPELILIDQHDCPITFTLSDDTAKHFIIEELFSSDTQGEFTNICFAKDARSLSLINKNMTKQLISCSILVKDLKRNELINCDPQVINRPPS